LAAGPRLIANRLLLDVGNDLFRWWFKRGACNGTDNCTNARSDWTADDGTGGGASDHPGRGTINPQPVT
jgi:hypothetical protein